MAHIRRSERPQPEYVGSLLAELRRMTNCERRAPLTYLIEMAWLEARDIVDNDRGSNRDGNKRDAVA